MIKVEIYVGWCTLLKQPGDIPDILLTLPLVRVCVGLVCRDKEIDSLSRQIKLLQQAVDREEEKANDLEIKAK